MLVIHGGNFAGGLPTGPQINTTCEDLAAAGYLALSITYRMDAQKLPGQTSLGVFPEQTDDCKTAVLAARVDKRGTGKVGALGGSAGGSHAVFIASTGTPGADKVDVAVGLSGAYLYSDPLSLADRNFSKTVTAYCSCRSTDIAKLFAASPAGQPTLATASPMLLIASVGDVQPDEQLSDMAAALSAAGNTSFQTYIYQDQMDHHSFDIWPFVKTISIAFLDGVLKK